MKYEYTVHDGKSVAYLTIREKCGIHDLEQALAAITRRDDFNPAYDQLTDLRECRFDFGPGEMSEFFTMFTKAFRGQRGSTAVLASRPQETALTMFHANKVSEARNFRVFSTRDAALKWLSQVAD